MIILNDLFKIDRDTYNWILIQNRPGISSKTGEPIYTEVYHYFSSLKQCLTKFIDLSVTVEDNIPTIIEKLDVLNQLAQEVVNANAEQKVIATIMEYNGTTVIENPDLFKIAEIYWEWKML